MPFTNFFHNPVAARRPCVDHIVQSCSYECAYKNCSLDYTMLRYIGSFWSVEMYLQSGTIIVWSACKSVTNWFFKRIRYDFVVTYELCTASVAYIACMGMDHMSCASPSATIWHTHILRQPRSSNLRTVCRLLFCWYVLRLLFQLPVLD